MAAKKKTARRPRTAQQIGWEQAREANDKHGKTLIRHTKESAAALKRVAKRLDVSGPEAMRTALVEMDARSNR